ncbi:Sau3AI family type II restriction endonuclease [Staphylococcus pettenkoferi]|uniref:Sau3AI family type II restriction endonuclease n=1 Tax=Staphylococcus pettenkoferi TaxID=170573 RepID=UPI002272434C|nr:Sau3AI family type II restriction endonuclease [Staphylococcus pettenkoferi]MCY1573109.1 Sau3AI family type II restriction endonuclease [Staphylococcus pettenkoferi]MCY1579271.1 Sau3AI family type II restriction endonuclease [Staphylococcus pettenkoferi]
MENKRWKSVEEVHNHAKKAVNKKIKDLTTQETVEKYYANTKNKGWIGNAIESDWFDVPNNSRKEADIPYLGLEIKVTPIKSTKKGWSAKERLVLNIFDFKDEYKREFKNASFIEKTDLTELLYYEYIKDIASPELKIKAATLFDFNKLPKEDLLIIEQDWNIIIDKIKEGKAEELSDSLTKYLGATTKGGKSEKNLTAQPFSDKKAHRRAFTLKSAYMTELARKNMAATKNEKLIKDTNLLKEYTLEDIVLNQFAQYVNLSKQELGEMFDITIPKKNDKASTKKIAKKMLNIKSDIENTDEFKKAGIAVKNIVVTSNSTTCKEGFKIIVPGESTIEPEEIINDTWEESSLREYLSSYKFLLVIFEDTGKDLIFRGAKFWSVPIEDLDGDIKETWLKTQSILSEGVSLEYERREKPTPKGKLYQVSNNLPGISSGKILHVRPSAVLSSYYKNSNAMRLPVKSNWKNKPKETDWVAGTKPGKMPQNELTDYYMTKQMWWLNPKYMYKQISEFFC